MVKINSGAFLTKSAGGLNVENIKTEMKTCLERFSPKESDSKKVKLMKELLYGEVKTATNTYLDNIIKNNKI
ncbi:TPA: hypothetical protein DCZ39_07195 [Patescibacteria group bacterium]|nr:hypothetical protein [Candidatus Gracilibacteria bacterium]